MDRSRPARCSRTSCRRWTCGRSPSRRGERLHRALALYEELGDRQGIMASIIAMAYLSWGADIHMGSDSAKHIEEIRRLASQLASFTSESQRAFARCRCSTASRVRAGEGDPDLALSRGREARSPRGGGRSAARVPIRRRRRDVLSRSSASSRPRGSGSTAPRRSPRRVPRRSAHGSSSSGRDGSTPPAGRRTRCGGISSGRSSWRRSGDAVGPMRGALDARARGASGGRERDAARCSRSPRPLPPRRRSCSPLARPPRGAPGRRRARDGRPRPRRRGRRGAARARDRRRPPGRGQEDMNLDVLLPVAEAFAAGGAEEADRGRLVPPIPDRGDRQPDRGRGRARPVVPGSVRPSARDPGRSGDDVRSQRRGRRDRRDRRPGPGCCDSSSRACRTRRSRRGSASPRPTSTAGSPRRSRRSARPRAPTRPRSLSSRGSCSAPRAGRPTALHRRGQLHHDRPDRVRLRTRATSARRASSTPRASTRRSCGRPRSHARRRRSSSRRSPSSSRGSSAGARRRSACSAFMFTDIVGSTSLLEAMGDEAWQSLLSWHDKTLRALFAANRGEEVTATGDGFFVAFESPDDALACAAAIQRGLADHLRAGSRRRSGSASTSTRRWWPSPARASTRPRGSAASRTPARSSRRADRRGRRLPGAGPAERDGQRDLRPDRGRHGRLALSPGRSSPLS